MSIENSIIKVNVQNLDTTNTKSSVISSIQGKIKQNNLNKSDSIIKGTGSTIVNRKNQSIMFHSQNLNNNLINLLSKKQKPSKYEIGLRRNNKRKETFWKNNFQFMCSKDNALYPPMQREYFDTPLHYSIAEKRMKIFTPSMKFYGNIDYNLKKKLKNQLLPKYLDSSKLSIRLNSELLKKFKQLIKRNNYKHSKELKHNKIGALERTDDSKPYNCHNDTNSLSNLNNLNNMSKFTISKEPHDINSLKDLCKEFNIHSHSVSSSKVHPLKRIFYNFARKSSLNSQGLKIQNNDIIEDKFIQIPYLRTPKKSKFKHISLIKEKSWNSSLDNLSANNSCVHLHYKKLFNMPLNYFIL